MNTVSQDNSKAAGSQNAAITCVTDETKTRSIRMVDTAPTAISTPNPFPKVSCSQCGRSFGPGIHGYSHCQDHRRNRIPKLWELTFRVEKTGNMNPLDDYETESPVTVMAPTLSHAVAQAVADANRDCKPVELIVVNGRKCSVKI